MCLMEGYVESAVGFSPEAFREAHEQGVGTEESAEWELTKRAYGRFEELVEEGKKIDMVLVSPGKIIILHSGSSYEVVFLR